MTKFITAGIIIIVLYLAYSLFVYWEKVRDEEDTKEAAAKVVVHGDQLAGMPSQLDSSLKAAQQAGLGTFRKWLETYGPSIQDPRKAWIELDFCVAVSRDNPKEAQRIFAQVKARTKPGSPVYTRMKQLESSFE